MKTNKEERSKVSIIVADPRLDEIFASRILFPEKLAPVNEIIAKCPLPDKFKKRM